MVFVLFLFLEVVFLLVVVGLVLVVVLVGLVWEMSIFLMIMFLSGLLCVLVLICVILFISVVGLNVLKMVWWLVRCFGVFLVMKNCELLVVGFVFVIVSKLGLLNFSFGMILFWNW